MSTSHKRYCYVSESFYSTVPVYKLKYQESITTIMNLHRHAEETKVGKEKMEKHPKVPKKGRYFL